MYYLIKKIFTFYNMWEVKKIKVYLTEYNIQVYNVYEYTFENNLHGR